jgi:hypothetical protein
MKMVKSKIDIFILEESYPCKSVVKKTTERLSDKATMRKLVSGRGGRKEQYKLNQSKDALDTQIKRGIISLNSL